jgi:hypothetical protein
MRPAAGACARFAEKRKENSVLTVDQLAALAAGLPLAEEDFIAGRVADLGHGS